MIWGTGSKCPVGKFSNKHRQNRALHIFDAKNEAKISKGSKNGA